jgi:rhodanese-related sulfurtransferase
MLLAGCSAASNPVKAISQGGNSNTKAATNEAAHADGVRRVTTTELNEMMKKNEVFVVDVRNEASFNAGHIPGAKLMPHSEILNHVDELPKNKLIVTYCSWPNEHTSAGAVVSLKTKNITNAAALLGGFVAWQKEGYQVDKKQ